MNCWSPVTPMTLPVIPPEVEASDEAEALCLVSILGSLLKHTYALSVRVCYTKSSYTQRRNRSGNHSFHCFLPYEDYLIMCTGWTHDVAANWKCFKSHLRYGQSIQTPGPRLQVWGRAGGAMRSSSGWWQLFGSSPREARRGTQKSIWAEPAIRGSVMEHLIWRLAWGILGGTSWCCRMQC